MDLTPAINALNPAEADIALKRFATANPRFVGADWGDIVEILFDTDAHFELTEEADSVEEAVALVTAYWAGNLPTA